MLRIIRPLRSLPDGTRLTLSDRCVTAVYPAEGYLYVQEPDRSFGIRVVGDCGGLSVGDHIYATGAAGTVRPDGVTASERCVLADDIARVSSSGPPKPVGLACRAVGGGPAFGTVGVNDGFGLNNIGLLVRIAGRVTRVLDGQLMYVDDGSQATDAGGMPGVLVRCPDTAGFAEGDFVLVTGVVEGNVPEGWTVNRRFIRARTSDDVQRLP